MNLSKIAVALGLAATASEDDILAAIGQMAMPKQTMAACATALGLTDAAAPTEIIAAATAAAKAVQLNDATQFVPAATHQVAVDRLAELEKARRDALVAAATAEGKLPPANVAWAHDLIAKDEASFVTWAANTQAVLKPGAIQAGNVGAKTADELVAAATAYTAEQAAKGITVTADAAVRHVLNQGK